MTALETGTSRPAHSLSLRSDSARSGRLPPLGGTEVRLAAPRLRIHPAKPKVGLRTMQANEMWHIDTTVIRLLDGTRAYLHAVIDNFSRRSWRGAWLTRLRR